jgi:hypothetical protein
VPRLVVVELLRREHVLRELVEHRLQGPCASGRSWPTPSRRTWPLPRGRSGGGSPRAWRARSSSCPRPPWPSVRASRPSTTTAW